MKLSRNKLLMAMMLMAGFHQTAFAAAFQLYEMGTPVIGTAGVGQAAETNDASVAYYNPAGMALLTSTHIMLGSQIMVPYVNFTRYPANTIRGNNGGNAGALTPGMDFYYVYNFSPTLKFGVAMTSPYGGMLNYNDGWIGRFIVQNETFYTINLNPSVSYRVNNQFALGVGFAAEYINLQETMALPFTQLVDGQAKVSVDNIAAGYNLALMYTPRDTTKIGLAYRSRILHDLSGNTTFLRIQTTPVTSTKLITPQNVILSAEQRFNKCNLLAELGWANWASMQSTILTVRGLSAVIPRDWTNTYRLGLGGQYHATPNWMLQAGVSYDSSPTTSTRRTPDLPMDRQIRCGLGLVYQVMKVATVGASYEYLNFGRASINNLSTDGALVGYYSRNYANTFQISVDVQV